MLDLHPRRDFQEATVSGDDEKSSSRRAAAVLVVVVVLAAVAVAIVVRGTGSSVEEARAPVPASSSPTPQQSPSGAASSTTTGATPLPTMLPTAAPEGVSWSFFQGYALPSSETAGPLQVKGSVHAGYSHSPEGALLAAVQIGIRVGFTAGEEWRRVVEQQTIPSGGQDAFVKLRGTVTDFTVVPGEAPQYAGFRFVTYSPDAAVLQLATRTPQGDLQVGTKTVRWVDGDWKLEFQPDGGTSTTVQSVPDLAGFVVWGGS